MKVMLSLFYLGQEEWLKLSAPLVAKVFYSDKTYNLLSNKLTTGGASELNKLIEQQQSNQEVIHLNYEYGLYTKGLKLSSNTVLGIYISYKQRGLYTHSARPLRNTIPCVTSDFNTYKRKISQIKSYLKKGDSYQVNYTERFRVPMQVKLSLNNFLSSKQLSAYAHLTYIPSIGKTIISNSPESLYSILNDKIRSMPIKGTNKNTEELLSSQKDRNELNMITDLVRNDLTSIELNISRVLKSRLLLKVPGLYHTAALIEADLGRNHNELDVIKALFPGGSITGAPKLRTMRIIQEVESSPRGIYCGSTILRDRSQNRASINIRSGVFDHFGGTLSFGSGGGITLLSKTNSEYQEMLSKTKSFLQIFKN